MQAPQPMRSAILPSPSSLSFPNAPTLPSISPPSAAGQTSAQSAHLQDLQHQISVKTLAFQTLQLEYDSLLQKLERQRTKCATLEKKFEVSDVEINSLIDEKEKTQMQVVMLESQVEDLQQSRDEARHQLVANGAQYMRIMEMANKLQGQGAEDKKKWEAERSELEQRIRILEEAMVTGTEHTPSEAENPPLDSPGTSSVVLPHNPAASSTSQFETINVLRTEVSRLRSRTQSLETALQTMRRESVSIQAVAKQLVESGARLEDVAHGAASTDG
jgi:DNA repair exonuclease SbcCD ATPase subunit